MAEGGYDPRHRSSDSRPRQVCRFYLRNSCTKGDRCSFPHVRNGSAENNDVCKYYQMGCCAYGKKCKFLHVKADKHKDSSRGQTAAGPNESGHGSRTAFKEVSSQMVTLRKGGPDQRAREPDRGRGRKDSEGKWAQAQDFVPGKKFHGSVPSSYASAVQPHQHSTTCTVQDKDLICPFFERSFRCPLEDKCPYAHVTEPHQRSTGFTVYDPDLMCPFYEKSGWCPSEDRCPYAHAYLCEFCGLPKLHPSDKEKREKHIKECIEEHEKQMEHAFAVQASSDKECGICLENVVEKGPGSTPASSDKRFGILENCNHCFCLSCIRTWRQNKSDVIQTQRTCPTCRTHSDFVTPSKFWVESPKAKRKLIDDYKKAMSTKNCQYFKRGKGECPFDDRCFYKHALENGTIVHENIHRRRRRTNAAGERDVEEDYSLWDFITRREEDGHLLSLDAQLSLVLLGMFDSDDDDDNNNSFALRYNFLNGDFYFTDSDTDTDSD